MAKNKSKSSKSSTKKTAGSGHGIMGMDKSHTSTSMKVIISILIIAFISMFLYGGVASLIDLFKPNPNAPAAVSADPVAAAKAQFETQVNALKALAESQPTSYTPQVNLANSYFDWALQLAQASQTSTAAATAATPLWGSAKETYAKALAIKPGDPAVTTDFAIVTFYSGDTMSAIAIAEPVTKANPTFALAWLNLGMFYEASAQPAKAIVAYERFLKLDPTGKLGNADYAKTQLTALKKAATTATTTP